MTQPAFSEKQQHQQQGEGQNFHNFFDLWLSQQSQQLEELVSASKHHHAINGTTTTTTTTTKQEHVDTVLIPLIRRVVDHYENYYGAKSKKAKLDVFAMFNPSWRSNLEDSFLWIGGWRPSIAFHVLYSKSGLQLEARLAEVLKGLRTGDIGDLSPTQLCQVDALQRKTIREEKEISEKLASTQETVADASMVELSHAVTESMRENKAADQDRVESTLEPKEKGLADILQMADDLRLRTLKEVIKILSPIQAVHFLTAAAELNLRMHDWGKKRDATHQSIEETNDN